MKPIFFKTILFLASASLVMGCSPSNTQSQNTAIGAVGGAIVGGVAGSAVGAGTGQAIAIGVGAIGGAIIGGAIGHSMDHSDRVHASYALDHTPKKKKHHWKNKKTGTKYTVTPTTQKVTLQGHPNCRKYNVVVDTNGKLQKSDGIACQKQDGSWHALKA